MQSSPGILDQGQPSSMAEQAAAMRAVHQLLDAEPKIFADPLAMRILGPTVERWVRANLDFYRRPFMAPVRGLTVIRSRFAEDELLQAIAHGATQYVVLGAGLDTFAYRRADLADRLTVFEVDHPATQHWKRARLAEIGIEPPPNLRFVPLDFQRSSLPVGLAASGFDRGAPTFFSWLGVVYYISRPAALDTFTFIATQRAASQVVFDFALENSALSAEDQQRMGRLMRVMKTRGEPWIARFDPDALTEELKSLGFRETFYLSSDLANERYLLNRADNLQMDKAAQIMSARR